ncbi:M4 family metallopeptidase [Paenibacillus larvae]|nr:M4 family metallopeptidase [Paenibacillus larvae]MDT2265872.1 M4 family metallopeptidase [Paenibacillus larvae]
MKAVEIYYHALTHYLTPYANFSTMRVAAIQAAKDLFGDNSNEAKSVTKPMMLLGFNKKIIAILLIIKDHDGSTCQRDLFHG